nr:MAG TPA: hypothetical protein [Caudoviricetes sp.]
MDMKSCLLWFFVFLTNTFYQSNGSFLIHFSSESSK